jgi:hypothetical protein
VIPADRSGNEIRSHCDILSSIPLSSGCKSQSNDLPEGEVSRIPRTSFSPPIPRQLLNVTKFFRQNRRKSLSGGGVSATCRSARIVGKRLFSTSRLSPHNGRIHLEGKMTLQATVYRILIAAPDDVIAEQKAIQEIISSWNTKYSARMKAVFLPVLLETHLVQETSDRPKAIFDKQLIKDCDIFIGVFWTRIGTESSLAESITIEEIKEFVKAGKSVMIYLSSAPVVPGSIDLKQYGKLMKFMNECLLLGLVNNYNSILDFREKLSTQIVSNILKLHKVPEGETRSDPGKTARKEINDRVSKRFYDLIERYNINWTSEKKIKPMNLDVGRKIIIDLTREILSLKDTLAKIFRKELIEHIDQTISNLMILQKHRLYFDDKSYADFWKSGDEIFASLDAIAGEVRNDKHIPKIDTNMENILIELSKIKKPLLEPMPSDVIAKTIGISITETNYYLIMLLKAGFISHLLTIGAPTRYLLRDAGRRFLVEKGIK